MHYFFTLKPKTYMFAVSSIIIEVQEVLVPFVTSQSDAMKALCVLM